MDVFLAILGSILILSGLVGSVAPILPGPPLSWLGVLLLHFTDYADFSNAFLIISAFFMILITVLDYLIPMWGTKKFGGSRAGVIGSTLGLLVGIFVFPPFGIIVGPFAGAFIGELLMNREDTQKALKSATGSFIGFLLGTGLKLVFGGIMAFYFVAALF